MVKAKKVKRNDSVIAVMEELLKSRFDNNKTALARALGVSGPYISEVMGGTRNLGIDTLESLSDLTGQSIDALVGRRPKMTGRFGDDPRWKASRADAEKRLKHLRPELLAKALDTVAAFSQSDVAIVMTGYFVARLAEAVAENPKEF